MGWILLPNGVTVTLTTLTRSVRVRILDPQPQKKLSFRDNFFYFYSNTHPPIFSDGQPSITSATALECVIKIIFAHAHSPILSYKRPALYVPE